MTKRDYALIAETFKSFRPEDPVLLTNWCEYVKAMSDTFRRDNPRFDPYRFKSACLEA